MDLDIVMLIVPLRFILAIFWYDTGIGKEVTGICPNSWHVWRILNNYLVQIEDYASDTVTQQQ